MSGLRLFYDKHEKISDSFERGVKAGVEYNIDKLAEVIESEIMGSEGLNSKLMQ